MIPQPLQIAPIRISQGLLTRLSSCDRQFQYLHLEQLAVPEFENQARQEEGQRFHQLMQQWDLQLPVEMLLDQEPQLAQWYEAFCQAQGEILPWPEASRTSEQTRSLEREGYLLSVVYDLLLETPQQAQIVDWKTYAKPRQIDWLRTHWQTRLYLYVLCETTDYQPEQVAMVYWFFQTAAGSPQSERIAYSSEQHHQTEQDLRQLLHQLTQRLAQFEQGQDLPQLPLGHGECEHCSFAYRCDRPPSGDQLNSENSRPNPGAEIYPLHWQQIEEIPIE
jgi:hypothetical protein